MTIRPTIDIDVDFVNDPSSATETWTSIKQYARVTAGGPILSCSRGRNYERAKTTAGSIRLSLDNTDGRFDPSNPQSPYITGTANPGGLPGRIVPRRRIRIRATWLGVTYGVWRGYVNEWPQEWSAAGFRGKAGISGSDAIAVLAQIDLLPAVVWEMLQDDPVGLYRLNDAEGSTSAGNSSDHAQPLSQIVAGSTAATTDDFQFGQTAPEAGSNLDGDPTGCLLFSPGWNGTQNLTGYALRTADLGTGPILTSSGGLMVEGWVQLGANNNLSTLFIQYDNGDTQQVALSLVLPTPGGLSAKIVVTDGTNTAFLGGTTRIDDGGWHHIAGGLDADQRTPLLFVDGIDQTSLGGLDFVAASAITFTGPGYVNEWGGLPHRLDPAGSQYLSGGLKNVALYDAPLTAARALAHFQAGRTFTGETSGARVARLLDIAAWPSTLRSIATGSSTVGSQSLEATKVLSGLEQVVDTEQGNLFIDRDGKVAFTARSDRYNGTSAATFGENPGEYHYTEGLTVQLDEREIVNDWQVSRSGGITVRNTDPASQLAYFPASGSLATIAVDDAAVVYTAEYLLDRYSEPLERIPQLVLDPQGNADLWPQVLGREIGDQITVTRRPGAALAKSADYFIESISHDISKTSWKTTWQLSPASVAQVFEIESATYGRLGGSCPLTAGINSSVTSLSVDTTLVEFSQTATPYTVLVDAEEMTVTAAGVPAANVQVLTVTRAVNNTVAASHSGGADVALAHTYGLAL